jgi:hypothetical protein
MPPEYMHNLIVSNKFDVFSLGVVIIRVVAGNKGYYRGHHELSRTQFIELVRKIMYPWHEHPSDFSTSHVLIFAHNLGALSS